MYDASLDKDLNSFALQNPCSVILSFHDNMIYILTVHLLMLRGASRYFLILSYGHLEKYDQPLRRGDNSL